MWLITKCYCTDDEGIEPSPEPVGDDAAAIETIRVLHTGHDDPYPRAVMKRGELGTPMLSAAVVEHAVAEKRDIRIDLTVRGCRPSWATLTFTFER